MRLAYPSGVCNARIKAAFVACAILLFGSMVGDASQQRINLRVSPRMSYAPADLFIYVSVERLAENRVLRVSAESSEFFRSSETPLEGEDGPKVSVFKFRQLPAGTYFVEAHLIAADGKTTEVARCGVTVL